MWEQTQRALDHSVNRMITAIANLLPGLGALIVALFVSAVVAWIVG